ncbi:transcriptional regulator [Streptomyces sp. p1417]|uniref:Transcriptional regulator n=1 Tax=Streptomyces typhae TaxID=2681492 RepID=A0A6L6WYU4_9ACTN|nr:BTAD domain-containing putative transcriptional regulator [Streptomyces typhae]MVO86685.1 transcriptional regulator [Streptomyces typhae]
MTDELRFGLLGVPALYGPDGEPHPVRSPKGRALLTALLLEPGRVVSADALKEALWTEGPPASAHASLQNHVTRLRRLLDDPGRLRAVPPGYRLRVDEGELDVRVFERRCAQARAAHAERDWTTVERAAGAALALWRGTPLSGLPAAAGHALVQRLEEARLLLLECRFDALLAAAVDPRGASAVELGALTPELTSLVAEHPLRENFHRQLMLVLHRTGRQAEALAVHRALRRHLVEELGVEPGGAVREAHEEVLRTGAGAGEGGSPAPPDEHGADGGAPPAPAPGPPPAVDDTGPPASAPDKAPPRIPVDPPPAGAASADAARADAARADVARAGAAPAGAASADAAPVPPLPAGPPIPVGPLSPLSPQNPTPPPRTPRPAQLPPKPLHFTGRTDETRRLRELFGEEGARRSAAPRVAVLAGMAGVGKSALALHAAHELRDVFPDGQLYLNLHGATSALTPGQALAALLRDLGAGARHTPDDPHASAALLRSLLAPTRTLLVLDDAASAAQVRPLLPGGPGCAVIVTSRSQLTALDGAARFPLRPLSDTDSAALLRAASGRTGLDAAHPLVALAGRLPLALRIVAARLAARRALTPDALAHLLADRGGRLHHLEHDDLSVRSSLDVALASLRDSDRAGDRDAARALCAVGALDLPEYGAPLLARVLRLPDRRTQAALDRLVDVALLDETAYGRYVPHDLVRAFAREHAEPSAASADRSALTWYDAMARRTLLAIVPDGRDKQDRLGPAARPAPPADAPAEACATIGVVTPAFATVEDAFGWADQELANIVVLAERNRHDATGLVPALVRHLFPYLQRRGRLTELARLGAVAVAAARRAGDPRAQAQALTDLAGHRFMAGRASEALTLNDEALALWWALDEVSCVRRGLNHRGLLLEGLGHHAESAGALHQALDLARTLDDPLSEATTYSHLGNLYEHTDARTAIAHHERSLAIGDRIGNLILRQSAHCNIGYARLTLGEPAAALAHFEKSLRLHGEYTDWHGESQSRLGLVRALRELARHEEAAREGTVLLDRAEHRGDTHMGGLARHQLGLLLHTWGRTGEAYAQWEAALAALESLDGVNAKVVDELKGLLGPRP